MVSIAKRNNTRLGIAIIILAFLLYSIAQTSILLGERECLEWGVIKRSNRTRGESWVPTNRKPMDREDAEQMARELEADELTGEYDYEARCKKFKE